MRPSVIVISGVLLLVIAIPAWAAGQGNWDDCNQRGDIDRRINGCTAIIQDHNESEANRARAYGNRGITYTNQGDFDRAIVDLSEAIRLDRTWAGGYSNRGRAYREKGDDRRAIADLTEAIRLDPRLVIAYYSRGRAHNNIGDFDRAMADFNEAIRLDPTSSPFPTCGVAASPVEGERSTAPSPTSPRRSGSILSSSTATSGAARLISSAVALPKVSLIWTRPLRLRLPNPTAGFGASLRRVAAMSQAGFTT